MSTQVYIGLTEIFTKIQRNTSNIHINLITRNKSLCQTYMLLTLWVYLDNFLCNCFQNPHDSRRICTKAEFNVNWLFGVIQGHVFWVQRKSSKGIRNIYNNVGLIS